MNNTAGAESRSRWWRLLRRPGLALPAAYAVCSAIGMLFYWTYFNALGIDIRHYLDPADLLMASFRQPEVWLILLGSMLLVHLDNLSSERFGRRPRSRWLAWYGRPAYRHANLYVGLVLVVGGIWIWGEHRAAHLERSASRIQIEFAEDGETRSGLLIGTSSRFLFLREDAAQQPLIVPIESLRAIRPH